MFVSEIFYRLAIIVSMFFFLYIFLVMKNLVTAWSNVMEDYEFKSEHNS